MTNYHRIYFSWGWWGACVACAGIWRLSIGYPTGLEVFGYPQRTGKARLYGFFPYVRPRLVFGTEWEARSL